MFRFIAAAIGVLTYLMPSQAGTREMLAALAGGDIAAMRAELETGADANGDWSTPPMATWLPVYLAAEAGRADMLAVLVEHGADIDRRDGNRDRPLDWAARYGEVAVARLLVDAGATPNPRESDPELRLPLVEAIDGGHVELAHFLLDRGADPGLASTYGGAPLYHAAALEDTGLAARLLAMGAAVAPVGSLNRETPLHHAAVRSTPAMIDLLTGAGAPPDARDWDGETPLFMAARLGRNEIVAHLMAAGAGSDIPDEGGRSPLVALLTNRPAPAYEKGVDDPFVSTRDLLLQAGRGRGDVDFDTTALLLAGSTQDLDTALAEAVWGGWGQAAHMLLARGALGQARTADGRAALAGAFHHPGLDMFERLRSANSNLGIDGGETMVAAAAAGRMDLIAALTARRWDIDARDPRGWTALLAAAVEGRVETAAELRALGADPAVVAAGGEGMIGLMSARLTSLACIAKGREASRAWLPTEHIRAEMARLTAAYAAILTAMDITYTDGALASQDDAPCL